MTFLCRCRHIKFIAKNVFKLIPIPPFLIGWSIIKDNFSVQILTFLSICNKKFRGIESQHSPLPMGGWLANMIYCANQNISWNLRHKIPFWTFPLTHWAGKLVNITFLCRFGHVIKYSKQKFKKKIDPATPRPSPYPYLICWSLWARWRKDSTGLPVKLLMGLTTKALQLPRLPLMELKLRVTLSYPTHKVFVKTSKDLW